MRAAALTLFALLFAGCGPEAGVWLRVEAPLVVPDDADSLSVDIRSAAPESKLLFGRVYDLNGAAFPHTLMLVTDESANGGTWVITASALKGGERAKPWSRRAGEVTVTPDETTELLIQPCDCP